MIANRIYLSPIERALIDAAGIIQPAIKSSVCGWVIAMRMQGMTSEEVVRYVRGLVATSLTAQSRWVAERHKLIERRANMICFRRWFLNWRRPIPDRWDYPARLPNV